MFASVPLRMAARRVGSLRSVARVVCKRVAPAQVAARDSTMGRWGASAFASSNASAGAPDGSQDASPGAISMLDVVRLVGLSEEKNIYTTTPDTPALEALRATQQEQNKALLVVDEDKNVCGIFCESDVMFRNAKSGSLHDLRVSDVMTTPVITSSGTAKLTSGLELLAHKKFQHLPVLSEAGEESLADGKVPLKNCNALLSTREMVKALMKVLADADERGAAVDAPGAEEFFPHMTLRELLKRQRKDKTLTCLINTQVDDDCSVEDVMAAMVENRVRSVLVVDSDDSIVGVVTSHDVVRRVLLEDRDPAQVAARSIMTKNPETVDASKTLLQATRKLMGGNYHHLPIVEGGTVPVGIVSLTDLVAALCPVAEGDAPALTRVQEMFAMLRGAGSKKPAEAAAGAGAGAGAGSKSDGESAGSRDVTVEIAGEAQGKKVQA